MKGLHIFIADGFEDIEALATYDVLVRAGLDVKLVSLMDEPFVTSSHGVTIGADSFLSIMDIEHEGTCREDIMIFPGGMPGTKNLAANKVLMKAMKDHYAAGGSLAAICAAPGYVLGQLDDWEGRHFTCFDGCGELPLSKGGVYEPEDTVIDGRIITGRSAGYAVSFGLAILDYLKGNEAAAKVRHAMYLD